MIFINISHCPRIINNDIIHGRNVEKAISINPKLTEISEATTLQRRMPPSGMWRHVGLVRTAQTAPNPTRWHSS
jgi:hypothetical protein